MNLDRRALFVIAAAGAVGVWALRSSEPTAARPTSGQGIVAFGDSLIEGRGAPPGEDAVSVLARRLNVRITNAGHSGDTTGAALARLDDDVISFNPRVVIVLLGGNDYLKRVPAEETFANLERIVTRIRQQGAAVILVGVGVGVMTDPYRARYEALARQTSAGLVPDILGGIVGHPGLMADSVHPNGRGYAMVADRIEPALRALAFP